MTGIVKTDQIQGAGSSTVTIPSGTALNVTTVSGTPTFSGDVTLPSINGGQIGGRRNMVINGKFQIFQRGSSATTVSGNDVFAADRFKGWANGGGTYTVEQSTDVPDNEFEFSAKLINTAVDSSIAAGDFYVYATDIEGHNVSQLAYGSSDAKAATLSFWVKASLAGTYCIAFYSVTASRYQIKEYTISSADTWEKKTITIASGDTTGSWNRTNGNGLRIYWDLGSGSTYQGTADTWASGQKFSTTNQANWIDTSSANFYLTGVQLEVGSQATPFEHRSFGEELALCQRYFEFVNGGIDTGMSVTTSSVQFVYRYRVEKRASATAALVGTPVINDGTQQSNINSVANTYHSFTSGVYLDLSTGTVNNNDTVLIYSNSATVGFSFDAEL